MTELGTVQKQKKYPTLNAEPMTEVTLSLRFYWTNIDRRIIWAYVSNRGVF